MGRVYDIKLSCGCLISLDGGGALIPCYSEKCKYVEEYAENPNHNRWQQEILRRNGYSEKQIKDKFKDDYVEIKNE